MLRKLFLAFTMLACGYVVWPALTALELKRAVNAGDIAAVESRVDWKTLRQSLHATFVEKAPDVVHNRFGHVPILGALVEKAALKLAPSVGAKVVDTYITPSGFVKLAALKRQREMAKGIAPGEGRVGAFAELYDRIKRVSFTSLTRIEIEVADRLEPAKRIIGAMELGDAGWRLTDLKFLSIGD